MLSQRAQKLKPSPTLALNAKAQEMARQGKDIISLAVGEPDWDTFENIKKVAIEAMKGGFNKYTPSAGIPELRKAIVQRLKVDHGLDYDFTQCMIGLGAKQTIFNALQVLCNPGDEVIIPAPYWVSYPTMVELADGKPVIAVCPKETSFKLTPDILKRSLTSKTKVLILNSPNNPTGQVYTKDELSALAQVLERTGVWIISDDIYDNMVFTGDKIAPHIGTTNEGILPRLLIANSVSKTYSMTGWRIGSLVGEKKVIDACTNYQSQSASCAVSFAQKGAVEALLGTQEPMQKAMVQLRARRELALKILHKVEGLDLVDPAGAFYIWPNVSAFFGKHTPKGDLIQTSADFAAQFLEANGVAVVPGNEFGMEGYLRMSYAIDEKRLTAAMTRFAEFASSLK